MNVLLIGQFGEDTQARIRAAFPADWRLEIAAPEEVGLFLAEAEAVIPEHIPVDEAFLAQAMRLRMVQTGAGYDNVDLAACTRRGVQVCNAAGVNAAAVAEHVLAFLLAYYKDLCLLNAAMHAGETAVPSYTGGELAGRTIGLVGLGRIGRAVAARCQAFGMRVIAWSYRPIEVPGVTLVDLPALYRESDIVSLHVPLKPETRAMIDARALAQMKPGALLVNTARGGLVDEAALVDALAGGQLGGPAWMSSPRSRSLPGAPCAGWPTSSSHRTPPGIPTASSSMRRATPFSWRTSAASSPARRWPAGATTSNANGHAGCPRQPVFHADYLEIDKKRRQRMAAMKNYGTLLCDIFSTRCVRGNEVKRFAGISFCGEHGGRGTPCLYRRFCRGRRERGLVLAHF